MAFISMAFIGVAWRWRLLPPLHWHIVAFSVCLLLGVALPHRPGAELQVSGLFLHSMCAPLHVLVSFTVCSGWGVFSFLEFFSAFLLYFPAFFPSIVRNCFLVLFLELLSVFPLDLGAFLLSSNVVAQSTCVGSFARVFKFLSMPTTQPTFNSLSADLFLAPSTSAPPSSGDSVAVSTVASGTLNSLPNEIAVAVAQALQQSLPTFVTAFRAENLAAPISSVALPPVSSVVSSIVSSDVSSVVSSSAMVAASSLSSVAGMLRLLPFVSTFPAISSSHQLFFARRKFGSIMRQGVCGWPG